MATGFVNVLGTMMAADFAVGSDEPMAEWAQPRIDKSAATRKSGSARTRIGIPSAGYGWRAEDFVIPASRNTLALGWRVKAWGSPSLKEKFCRLVLDAEKARRRKIMSFDVILSDSYRPWTISFFTMSAGGWSSIECSWELFINRIKKIKIITQANPIER